MTYIDIPGLVTVLQVSQDGSFIQVGQVGHIVKQQVLVRIHLLNFVLLYVDLLLKEQVIQKAI